MLRESRLKKAQDTKAIVVVFVSVKSKNILVRTTNNCNMSINHAKTT